MGKTYCVISHTHWDREWYQPFEEFRIRLISLMDNLFDILDQDERYRFHLDAQTIAIEDYLEIKPWNEEKIKKYVKEGRLLIGPWYVQNDFFLTSGEATIRNLLIGVEMANKYGKCMMEGYVPDQFGLISQLPQIFNKCGIDSCIFGRGYFMGKGYFCPDKKAEFLWRSEDGSEVLSVNLPQWYNNAQRFPKDIQKAMSLLEAVDKRLNTSATTGFYLLMNGCDHLEAQEDLLDILDKIQEKLPHGDRIIQDTFQEYIQRIQDSDTRLDTYTGEMRKGPKSRLLTNTLSSRVYLKQWNIRCQTLIENRLEPLYSFIHSLGFNEYPEDFLRYLWKLLIQNHPHDSICGCSTDEVHQHMMDRFMRFMETGESLLKNGMDFLCAHLDRSNLSDEQYIITIFNTNATLQDGVVDMELEFVNQENVEQFKITDRDGIDVPYVVLSKEKRAKRVLSPVNLPGIIYVSVYKIKLKVQALDAFSYRTYTVTPHQTPNKWIDRVKIYENDQNTLENQYLKVIINKNGTIDLFDKESKKKYKNLLLLEDREDIGDSYVYKENPEGRNITTSDVKADIKKIENHALNTTYKVSYQWKLPEKYCFDENKRSHVHVDIPVDIKLSLDQGSRQLDVSITIDNQIKDHRLRVLFPTGIDTDISYSGTPFDVINHNKFHNQYPTDDNEKVKQHCNNGYVNIDGDDYGFAIFNEGLYEYEHLTDEENTVALTLIRSNDYILRPKTSPDTQSIPNKVGLIPENQCQGIHTFRMSLYPHAGELYQSRTIERAQSFLNPLFTHYQPVDTRKFSGGRPFVQGTEVAEIFYRGKKYPGVSLPLEKQMLRIEGEDIILSCIKKKEKGDSLIVRVYNASSEPRTCSFHFFKRPGEAYLANLLEERTGDIKITDTAIQNILIKPKEIITVEIAF
jgi:alpha-mannosidase